MKIYIFYDRTQNIKCLILYSIMLFVRKLVFELNRSVYQHHNITYLKFYFHNRCSFFEDMIFVCIYTQTNGSIQVWCIKRAISHSAYCQSSGRKKILMIVHFHIAFLFLWLQSFQPLTCLTLLQGWLFQKRTYAVLTHCSWFFHPRVTVTSK